MGTATAPSLVTEPKYLCWEWMALGYFWASTSTGLGHGNGSVTKGRVLGAVAFVLGLAGWATRTKGAAVEYLYWAL